MGKPAVSDRINQLVFLLSASIAAVMLLFSTGFPSAKLIPGTEYQCQEFHCQEASCERTSTYQSPIDETNKWFAEDDGFTRTVVCEITANEESQ